MSPPPSTPPAAGDGAAPPPQAFAATGSPGGRANELDTGWTTASPAAAPAPPPVEKWPAPEPPRWRFVAEARKSRGYSSQNAGAYVEGRSSSELGAEYVAPEFTLERPTRPALEVGDLEYTPPPAGAPAIELPEVGRITFHENPRIGTDAPAGTFPGLPAPQGAEPPAIKASNEWDNALEAGTKARALPWKGGGDVLDSYAMPEDGTASKRTGGVGKIESHGVGGNTDSFEGEIARGVGVSDVDDHGHAREGALFPHGEGSAGGGSAAGGKGSRGLFALTNSADKDAEKKRRCLLLLLLIPLLLGILLAVLLGRGGGGDDDTVVAGVVGGVMLPPVMLVNETNATAVPSSYPSATSSPSTQVTPVPSARPTAKPTCGATAQEFHLCLALDMSGSVCNGDTDSDCFECRIGFLESVLPMFFTPDCRDGSVSEDTCCENFARVQDFAALLVESLEDVPADKSFSLVQFATEAQLARGPSSAVQTLAVIEQLDYTGGQTNHAAAIRKCQDALPATGDGKNAIVLVTDGLSTEPDGEAAEAAEAAAGRAKAAGTLVTPVFIDRENDEEARSFMGRISSDGRVFDVTDFGSLDSLRDQLVEQVSCS